MTRILPISLGLAALVLLCSSGDVPIAGAKVVPVGVETFVNHCTGCHGDRGRGDGPLAATLSRRPANLTRLRWKYATKFDDVVRAAIDGRSEGVRAEGSPMPKWGDYFRSVYWFGDESVVQDRIRELLAYLRTLQSPGSS